MSQMTSNWRVLQLNCAFQEELLVNSAQIIEQEVELDQKSRHVLSTLTRLQLDAEPRSWITAPTSY